MFQNSIKLVILMVEPGDIQDLLDRKAQILSGDSM
jgi:hypothetical protein